MTHRVTGEWVGLKRQQPFPPIDHLNPRSFSVDWESCILVRSLAAGVPAGEGALEFEFIGRSFRKEAPLCTAGGRLDAVPSHSLLSLAVPAILAVFRHRTAVIESGMRPWGRAGAIYFRAIGVPFGDTAGELRYALGAMSHKLGSTPVRAEREFLEYRGDAWSRIDDAPPGEAASGASVLSAG